MIIDTHSNTDKQVIVDLDKQFTLTLTESDAAALRDQLSNELAAIRRQRDSRPSLAERAAEDRARKQLTSRPRPGVRVAVTLYGTRVATGTYDTSPWLFNHGVIVDETTPLDSLEATIAALDKANDEGPTRIDTTTYGNGKVIFAPKFGIVLL